MSYKQKVINRWWRNLSLEQQFYVLIKHNDLIEGDRTRHPSTITVDEKTVLYKAEQDK